MTDVAPQREDDTVTTVILRFRTFGSIRHAEHTVKRITRELELHLGVLSVEVPAWAVDHPDGRRASGRWAKTIQEIR